MKKPIKYFIFIFAFLISNFVFAQQNNIWTLEECIIYALENNLQIKKQEIYNKITVNNYNQSRYNLLPTFNASAGRNYNFGDKFNVYTSSYEQGITTSDNISIGGSLTIFNGFKQLNTIKKTKLQILNSEEEIQTTKDNISIEIAVNYLNILYNMELLNIANEQLNLSQEQNERTKILVTAEKIAKNSLFEMEAQLAKDEYNLVSAENSLKISYITLYQLLDIQQTDSFKIAKPSIEIQNQPTIVYNLDEVLNYAYENRSEIKSSEYKLEVAEKDIAIAKSGRYPTVSLSGYLTSSFSSAYTTIDSTGTFQYIGNTPTMYVSQSGEPIVMQNYSYDTKTVTYNRQLNDNLYQYFGVSINIPIFNGAIVSTNVKNSKLNLENSKYDLEITRNSITKTITQSYSDANIAFKKYLSAKKMLEASEISFLNTKQKYELGLINTIDYKNAKSELVLAQSELVQSKYDYIFKITILDFYTGKPINFQ